MAHPIIGIFNLGGGEIVLLLVAFAMMAMAAIFIIGLVFFIVRAATKPAPQAPPPSLPPQILARNQQIRDREHFKLLAIFHFVIAGLVLLGIAFLFCHYLVFHAIFSNPDMWKNQKNATPPPPQIFAVFIWFYVFLGLVLATGFVLNLLSGLFLRQRRHRVFSLVVGALNCLQFPFGTALGVFTIVVLLRDSVRNDYTVTDLGGKGEQAERI